MVTRHALVTGATGGLGRALVSALVERGFSVRATGRNATIGATLGVPFMRTDLAVDPLEPLVNQIDCVFHLAALSSPWGRQTAFEAANVTATERLLTASNTAKVRSFIFTSTPSIYADARDRLFLTERDPPAVPFANAYAATKYAAECAVLAASGNGMRTIAIRPRAIVGPFDTVLLPRLLRAARSGHVRLPRWGEAVIEITDVRDVVSALIAADQSESVTGRVFNISGGAPRSLRDLFVTIFSTLGRSIRIGTIGTSTAMALAAMAERVASVMPGQPEPPLTRYMVKTLAWSQTFDLSAARDVLGWAPQYSPEAAILHALATAGAHD
jgi:nucleoside-diphosphate-sugar epimerase